MDAKSRKSLLLGLGGILWALIVLLGYVATHKPFGAMQAMSLLRALWQTLVAVGALSLAGALGVCLFPPRAERLSPLSALAIQAALGIGILGTGILLLGSALGFSALIFGVLFAALAFLLRKNVLTWWREWRAARYLWRESALFEKALLIGVFFMLAARLLKSLAPPLAFDSLVYHLTLPRIYLLNGRFSYIPELSFWGMPQIMEMWHTFTMALGGAEAAVVFNWLTGLLTLLGLYGYVAERFSSRAASVALVSLLVGKTLAVSLSWAYVEWPAALFGLGVFILLDLWTLTRKRKYLWIAALLAGFAVGTKYTAGVLPVAALPVIFLANHRRGVKAALLDLFSFAGIALFAFSPWLLKNLLATGNPVYPLLFPSGAMDANRLHLYQGGAIWGDWRDFFLLPWRATVLGAEGKVGYSADIGPLLLGFSPLLWLGWTQRSEEQRRTLKTALMMTVTGLFVWAVAGRISQLLLQSRLYFALLPIWAILAGVGFESLARVRVAGVRFGRLASVLAVLALGFSVFSMAVSFAADGALSVLLGAQTRASYREQALGAYETALSSIDRLPADARVLMLWETRGFACWPRCEPDELIDRWYADYRRYGSADAVLDAWRAAGYTYLLVHQRGVDFIRERPSLYTESDWRALDAALARLDLLRDFDDVYSLYALK